MRLLSMLLTIAGLTSTASADKRLTCDMTGNFVEDRDDFRFMASYVAKDGPDTFSGVYSNPSAGTTANVQGVANNGTWTIQLTYTDAKHSGVTRQLIGKGARDGARNEVTISGNHTMKKGATQVSKGTFRLHGKCK